MRAWALWGLAACRASEVCTLSGEACELRAGVIERLPRAPPSAFEDWEDVRVEVPGEWLDEPICVQLEGVALPDVDSFRCVAPGELPLSGDPGSLVGWVTESACGQDVVPTWRLTQGEVLVGPDGPWLHVAVGRWDDGALVGEIRGPGSGP